MLNLNKVKRSFFDNLVSLSFISSFSFLLSVFIWRYYLINFLQKEIAIYFFLVFAIASFPGTFFNNFLGMTLLKNKENNFGRLFFLFSLSIIILLIVYILFIDSTTLIQEYHEVFPNYSKLFMYSILGSMLMVPAMKLRINLLYDKNFKNYKLFSFDVIYGIIIASIVPIIGYIFTDYLYLSYLIGSIISLIFYTFVFKLKIKKII